MMAIQGFFLTVLLGSLLEMMVGLDLWPMTLDGANLIC